MSQTGQNPHYALNPSGIAVPVKCDANGILYMSQTVNDLPISASNPEVNISNIMQAISNGLGFSVTTGKLSSSGSLVMGMSLFNPSGNSKTLYVYSAKVSDVTAGYQLISFTLSDPGYPNSASIINAKVGSTTTSGANCTYTSTTGVAPVGTIFDVMGLSGTLSGDFLSNGDLKVCPPGYGIAMFINTATNNWAASFKYLEM